MADEQSPIPDIPNFADAQILQDKLRRTEAARRAGAPLPEEQEQQVGPEGTSQKTHVGILTEE
jgi:hypothetical protein